MRNTTKSLKTKVWWGVPGPYTLLLILLLFIPSLKGNAQTYCTPVYSTGCSWGDDLNSFVLTGHAGSVISDLNTGCNGTGGYDNRTSLFTPVDVMPGQSYTVEMNTNYSSNIEYVSIWIDFDNNGTFSNTADEKLLTDVPLPS